MKNVGIIRRKIAVLLIVALSINSFAAVVSDNDGSAFITKAEFDSLKNNFQTQIDSYNQSIDNKIDGAIATYLQGLTIAKTTSLSLPAERGYQFPLIYDTADKWNDITSTWFLNVRPELHQKRYEVRWFTGDYRSGNVPNWPNAVFEASLSELHLFDVPGAEPARGLYWNGLVGTEYEFMVPGVTVDAMEVKKSSDVRNVTGHPSSIIYDLQNFGLGKAVVNYAPHISYENYTGNSGALLVHPTYNENFVYYPYCFGFQYDWKGSSTSMSHTGAYGEDRNWQTLHLMQGMGGNVRRPTETTMTIPVIGGGEMWGLRPLVKNFKVPRGNTNGSMLAFIDENASVDNSSISWQSTGITNRIYGQGVNCPILSSSFSLYFQKPTSNIDQAWWECVYGYKKPNAYAAFSTATISQLGMLVAGNFAMMPKNTVAANTTFDASDTEYFSQLPSSLVRYKAANGDTHYIDEGMWLGKIDKNGSVTFTVNFGKDSGSGTKVKLHASNKPFSFEYDPANLIDIKLNSTTSKEPELNYNVPYTVTLENINKDDNLYLEWVPSDSGDLSKLLSFQDFALISED